MDWANEYYDDEEELPQKPLFRMHKRRNTRLPKNRRQQVVKTHWNQDFKDPNVEIPYAGYQHPDEIDWSQYGPDRPGKRKKQNEYLASEEDYGFENSLVAKLSFFGLLLPGILGTLFFLGVPIAKVITHINSWTRVYSLIRFILLGPP